MRGSQSESSGNHTNGIQKKQHASLVLSYFHFHLNCPAGQLINNGILIAGDLAIPPSLKKGNKCRSLTSLNRKPHQETVNVEFVFGFYSVAHFPNVFSP
jgi:hypothetical protein